MARVLIAGCGYVGTQLALNLTASGHEVWGLRRNPQGLPAEVRSVTADLSLPATLTCLPDDPELVVYAASAGRRDDAAYRRAYVDGPRHLIERLARSRRPPRRLVFVSSTGVFGEDSGAWVDEETDPLPSDFGGRRLLEGERVVGDGPVPAVVVRLGGIYGPGRTRLIEAVRQGRSMVPPGPPVYSNRIHRDDCAGLLAHLLFAPEPHPLYLGVDHEPAALGEVVAWLAGRLGVSIASPAPADRGARAQRANKRCRNRRIVSAGYRFAFPTFREGYAALLAGASIAGDDEGA